MRRGHGAERGDCQFGREERRGNADGWHRSRIDRKGASDGNTDRSGRGQFTPFK
jgi:hypothetical protein